MLTKEKAIKKVKSLIERFDEQKEFYTKSDYNETQTRCDFIVNTVRIRKTGTFPGWRKPASLPHKIKKTLPFHKILE